MKPVVDANILFAAFIKDSYTRRLLLFSIEELFTPEFIYDEIKKHIVELKKKTGLSENQIDELFSLLIETKEGVMKAFKGDWIIKEPFPTGDRDFYPCKDKIFRKTYEQSDKLEKEMHLNMQYYMEYCQANGYVTPIDWIEKHKHF